MAAQSRQRHKTVIKLWYFNIRNQDGLVMMSEAAAALFRLKSPDARAGTAPSIKLGDTEVRLSDASRFRLADDADPAVAYVDGRGGFKKVHGLPDGRAVAIPNLDTFTYTDASQAEGLAATWIRAVAEEKAVSEQVKAAGLEAQTIELTDLDVDGHKLPVMVMPRFATLAEQGIQIRDRKNPTSSCGHSMFFGTPQNLESPQRLRHVMQGLADDAALSIENGFRFAGDSCNLAIMDAADTPAHDRNALGLFDERQQKIRFFFFDFSSKHGARSNAGLPLLTEAGEPNREKIKQYAASYVGGAYETLMQAISTDELEHILELKKAYPSQHAYANEYDIFPVLDDNIRQISPELTREVTDKVIHAIEQMPMEERLKRFGGAKEVPPPALPGNGNPQIIVTAPKQDKERS